MATSDERIKLLKMIQEGKITPEQGVQLLEALEEGVRRAASTSGSGRPGAARGAAGQWFRVVITDTNTGKGRVNVRLPVGLVSAGIKMGARFTPQVEGFDTEELMAHLQSGETGRIIDIYNDDSKEHIEVFIE